MLANAAIATSALAADAATRTATSLTRAASPAGAEMVTDSAKVYTVPQVAKPAYLAPGTDPTFGSSLERITGDTGGAIPAVSGSWGADARHHYSKTQPWNADGTLIMVENRSPGAPPYLLLDGTTYAVRQSLCSSLYDYRWHPVLPHIMVNANGGELSWYDVTNCSKVRSWPLPINSDYGIGSGEGNPSASGRFIAIGNQTQVVVVDMDPQPPLAPYPSKRIGPVYTFPGCGLSSCAIDNLSISPSGRYLVVNYVGTSAEGYGQTRVFDVDTTTLTVTGPHSMAAGSPRCPGQGADGWILSWNHFDMALDPFSNDEDVCVGGPECGNTAGHPTKVRLSDGAVTALTSGRNEAAMFHASCRNAGRPGWAYFSFWKEDGMRFSDEIVAIKLDGSQTVERLAHTHTLPNGCYACEAQPVPSLDGKRVIFASNWAQDCGSDCGSATDIKDYVAWDAAAGGDVAVEASLVSADATADRVRLTWYVLDTTGSVVVYRWTAQDGWTRAGDGQADGSGYVRFEDDAVVPGSRYGYRIGVLDGGVERMVGETWIDVPTRTAGTVLAGARPNPARDAPLVAFSIESAGPVELELLDLNGRRLSAQRWSTLSAGDHLLAIGHGVSLAPGIYWVRLTHEGRSLTCPVAIVR